MFEPHHQLETRILSSYFDVSTYPGEESLQALTKGDENLLLRPPYPTPSCSRTTDVLPLGTQTVITATGHLAIDEWMLVLCRVNSHAVIQVFTQFFAHLLGSYPQGAAQAPARSCLSHKP